MDIVINTTSERFPAKAKVLNHYGHYYLNGAFCCGMDPAAPALADLFRFHHQLEGAWLIASPIHWEATHNDAMIQAIDHTLELTEQESRMLFHDVAPFLQEVGIDAVYHDTTTWLIKSESAPPIETQSVYTMLHQSMMQALNRMDKTLYWQRLITELQMMLSGHVLNAQRPRSLSINGLWFWGAGSFKMDRLNRVITDDELFLTHPVCQPLTPTSVFEQDSIILIKYPHQVDLISLQEKTQKKSSHWYWNNQAYSIKPKRWWSYAD